MIKADEFRPELTWRDMQHIAVQSAVFFNPEDPDWQKTATGRDYSYKCKLQTLCHSHIEH